MSEVNNVVAKPSLFAYVAIFIACVAILAIFGDTFIFILGVIGLVVTFAAFYKEPSHDEAHH